MTRHTRSGRRRVDVLALLIGILSVLIAAIALWAAFGTINWRVVAIVGPLALVLIGGLGLFLGRHPKKESKNG